VELVANGGFASDANWTYAGTYWDITGGEAVFYSEVGESSENLYQCIDVEAGNRYDVGFNVTAWSEDWDAHTGCLMVWFGIWPDFQMIAGLEESDGEGTYSYNLTATKSGRITFGAEAGYESGDTYIKVDDVSVKKAAGAFSYDYLGRRSAKTVGNTTTRYCYDGAQVIAEYENGTLVRKFIYGPGIDEPILMIDVSDSNKKYYYHFDGLGSVVALSDISGNIKETYEYDVFGGVTIRDANDQIQDTSLYDNPYMFTGRRLDSETGLYYYRARYYRPEIGRFLQVDPVAVYLQAFSVKQPLYGKIPGTYLSGFAVEQFLDNDAIGNFLQIHPAGKFLSSAGQFGFPVELNLYTYCGNNSMIYLDPYGLWKLRWKVPTWFLPVGLTLNAVGGGMMAWAATHANLPLGIAGAAVFGAGCVMDWLASLDTVGLADPHNVPGGGAFQSHSQQLEREGNEYPSKGGDKCPP
jgi:RHS repeat-associated protein